MPTIIMGPKTYMEKIIELIKNKSKYWHNLYETTTDTFEKELAANMIAEIEQIRLSIIEGNFE